MRLGLGSSRRVERGAAIVRALRSARPPQPDRGRWTKAKLRAVHGVLHHREQPHPSLATGANERREASPRGTSTPSTFFGAIRSPVSNERRWLRRARLPCTVAFGAIGLLSTGAGAQSQPTFPSRVEEVRIFVRAETRGTPRLDLRPEDFEVREDGKPVGKIRLIQLGAESSNLAETPIGVNPEAHDTSPGIAIIADDYLPVEEQIDYLREHLRGFIQGLEGGGVHS